jgi:hypothetical protein
MLVLYVTVKVRPTQTSHITVLIGAIVPQQKHGIFKDLIVLILDTEIFVCPGEILLLELLEFPYRIIREYHKIRFGLL